VIYLFFHITQMLTLLGDFNRVYLAVIYPAIISRFLSQFLFRLKPMLQFAALRLTLALPDRVGTFTHLFHRIFTHLHPSLSVAQRQSAALCSILLREPANLR
jgi:hypothetical protein